MAAIRVVLADDHPVARAGIRKILEKQSDIQVVGEAGSGDEALRLVKELNPDVLLLDMELPGRKGVEVARELQAAHSPVHILALSTYDNKQFILGLLSSGASGYLVKEEVPETIIEAVRGVARGEQGWVSRRIAANLAHWMQGGENEHSSLTDREEDVLRQLVAGKTNQEIAVALGISSKTVEKHIDSLYGKLGVASRVEAAVVAIQNGLV
jgi:DNA-binding NarL/FixJ family response regulator